MFGPCPTGTVSIRGIQLEALIDTGAQVTTLSEDFFRRNFPEAELKNLKGLQVTAANGLSIPYSAYIETEVIIEGVHIPARGIVISTTARATQGINVLHERHECVA